MTKNQTQKFKGLTLHKGQKAIVNAVIGLDSLYYTICTPRQWGKSTFAIQLMLYYAINYSDSNVMFVSLTYRQSSKVFKKLLKGIQATGIVKTKDAIENSITLINDSEIFFVSIQQPDNLLGYDIDYMFLDEASRYKSDTFERVLRPMLFVRGKKCILLSTPKGKNWFYKMFKNGEDEDNTRYQSFKGVQADNPFGNKEELIDAKKKLPDALYRQEYLAEFIDDGGDVFNNVKEAAVLNKFPILDKKKSVKFYAGIDVARQNDYTVLTIIGSDNLIYEILRINKTKWSIIASKVAEVLHKYQPKNTLVEINGVGDVFYELLEKKYKKIEGWLNTNTTKQDVIEELIVSFQDLEIMIPTQELFPYLYDELLDFTFTYSTQTRKIKYAARTDHDDCVMSLALAHHCKTHRASRGSWSL